MARFTANASSGRPTTHPLAACRFSKELPYRRFTDRKKLSHLRAMMDIIRTQPNDLHAKNCSEQKPRIRTWP